MRPSLRKSARAASALFVLLFHSQTMLLTLRKIVCLYKTSSLRWKQHFGRIHFGLDAQRKSSKVLVKSDAYIHDYLVKRDLKATAQGFQAEGKVSSDHVVACSNTIAEDDALFDVDLWTQATESADKGR